MAAVMSDLLLVVVGSLALAVLARSYWRRLIEIGIFVVLFVFFIGILTIITEARVAFTGA